MKATSGTEPIAVRVETAARMLDAPPSTVVFWIRTGKLPAYKIGRAWRVRVEDIHSLSSATRGALE
jgi:excisionase family DNA binding protein